MQKDSAQEAPLPQTPKVERLLGQLRSALRSSVMGHGFGTCCLVLTAWLLFAFLADWGLRVPSPIRIGHGLILLALAGYFFWRSLLRPLWAIPKRHGLAQLFERSQPELDEVLSSSIQFQSNAGLGNPILIQRVLQRAEQAADSLDSSMVLDRKPMLQRLLKGLAAAGLLALAGVLQPMHTEIFFNRMFGGEMNWPRRTRLSLDLPGLNPVAEELDEAQTPGRLRLRVARGTDIPVLIRAEGQVPDQVQLHFEGGRSLELKRTGQNVFRTMLSSVQEDISFYATGGDDLEGRPRVEVVVLQPPDIQSIAVHIQPPAYTGEPELIVLNSDVQVLSGSRVRVHASTFPEDARGRARILPQDELVELQRGALPKLASAPEAVAGEAEEAPPKQGLFFDYLAQESASYQLLLEDKSGLTNPDPGLFQIKVIEDEAPEILVISPARSELEIVLGGVIPLRARFRDDFGVEAASWRIRPAQADALESTYTGGEFSLRQLPRGDTSLGDARLVIGSSILEVLSIGTPEAPVALDQRYVIELLASDTREPNANSTQSLPIRARVVTPESLIRRMQERLAQAGREARKLSALQTEKRRRVEELVETFEGLSDGELKDAGEGAALAAALAGQRRVLGDAQALSRSLARVAEDILFARLDASADPLLNFHLSQLKDTGDVGFQSEPWRAMAAGALANELGPEGFARNLVLLVDLALSISDEEVQQASLALDQAERALELGARIDALARASELQTAALGKMEHLLEKLAEWDNFQNVLALMRDILNRQKNLLERTEQYATDSKK